MNNTKKGFDLKAVENDVLQMLNKLDTDASALEAFGPLVTGIENWVRLVKNKQYSTYFIDMYIGSNRLQYNGELSEVEENIKKWFETISL